MKYIIFAVVAIVLFVSLASWFFARRRRDHFASILSRCGLEPEKKDVLSLQEVIAFFKQPSAIEKLRADQDLTAVAIKEKIESCTRVVLCLYSKKTETISDPRQIIDAQSLDADLLSLFGDKDMLVLK